MRVVSGLDASTSTFPIICSEPHPFTVTRFFRPMDFALWGGATLAFPGALLAWEQKSPTLHPRYFKRVLLLSVPFFSAVGYLWAFERTMCTCPSSSSSSSSHSSLSTHSSHSSHSSHPLTTTLLLVRFWGMRENAREITLFEKEFGSLEGVVEKKEWESL